MTKNGKSKLIEILSKLQKDLRNIRDADLDLHEDPDLIHAVNELIDIAKHTSLLTQHTKAN